MKSVTLIAIIGITSGCGMAGMPGKMDKTNDHVGDMNHKMDETNDGLEQVNGSIDKTNEGVTALSDKVDRTNEGIGGLSGQLDKTNEGLAATNDGLAATNQRLGEVLAEIGRTNAELGAVGTGIGATTTAIHGQALMLALQEMMKPENTLVLQPPMGMMPGGKAFAGEATAEEVLGLTHTWLTDVRVSSVDRAGLEGQGFAAAAIDEMEAKLKRSKDVKLAALQVIGGFLPPATVEAIAKHVTERGRYRQDGLALLTMRAAFITMYLLEAGLFQEGLKLHGQMREAVDYADKLDQIGRLPFASELRLTTEQTGEVAFEPKSTLVSVYGEIDRRFDDELDPVYRDETVDDPVVKAQAAELEALRAAVKEKLAYWKAQP